MKTLLFPGAMLTMSLIWFPAKTRNQEEYLEHVTRKKMVT